MRIVGTFDLEAIKVTVFKMNERISVKFEYQLMEQTFKFRDGSGIQSVDDVKKFCSDRTYQQLIHIFEQMSQLRSSTLISMQEISEDEFDHIL